MSATCREAHLFFGKDEVNHKPGASMRTYMTLLVTIVLAALTRPAFGNWYMHTGIANISAGVTHTCAVLADHHVSCWGSGYAAASSMPTPVPGIENAVSVTSGNNFSCALLSDHTVSCWGENSLGQLGDGTHVSRPLSPAPVMLGIDPFPNVQSIAAGSSHICAVRRDGSVWCWGANSAGQLGNYTVPHVDFRQPIQVVIHDDVHGDKPLTGVNSVTAGAAHTCAVFADSGELACWGWNAFLQVGDDEATADIVDSPVAVGTHDSHGNAFNFENAIQLSAGGFGNCVVYFPEPTEIKCWGDNTYGQAGNLAGFKTSVPSQLTWITFDPLQYTGALAMGGSFGCAQAGDEDGADEISVVCWGSNDSGQLGNASISNSPWPLVVKKASGQEFDYFEVWQLVAGWSHACVLESDAQTVLCWGSNASGQLGAGTVNSGKNPVPAAAKVDAPIFFDNFDED